MEELLREIIRGQKEIIQNQETILEKLGEPEARRATIPELASITGKHPDTIRKRLLHNYAEGEHYTQSIENGVIIVFPEAAKEIRTFYSLKSQRQKQKDG